MSNTGISSSNSTPASMISASPFINTSVNSENKSRNTKSRRSFRPREKEFPMYLTMAKLCITPTGFPDVASRDAVVSKIELMCGEVSYSYTERTTHMLAAHANTPKVLAARSNNLPVMTLEWMESLWDACQQNNNPYLHASLPQFQNFECPLFYNLQFTLSRQYEDDTKAYYEKMITDYGGTITTKVISPSTHFYICLATDNGRSRKTAQKHKIHCIYHGWIVDSILVGNLMPTNSYEYAREDAQSDSSPPDIRQGTTFTIREDGPDANGHVEECEDVPIETDLILFTDECYNGYESSSSFNETVYEANDDSTLNDEACENANLEVVSVYSCANEADLINFTDDDKSATSDENAEANTIIAKQITSLLHTSVGG